MTQLPEPGLVQILWDAKRVRVVLSGSLDHRALPDFEYAAGLAGNTRRRVEIDCRNMDHLDVDALQGFTRLIVKSTGTVRLLFPDPAICLMLEETALDERVIVVSRCEDDARRIDIGRAGQER